MDYLVDHPPESPIQGVDGGPGRGRGPAVAGVLTAVLLAAVVLFGGRALTTPVPDPDPEPVPVPLPRIDQPTRAEEIASAYADAWVSGDLDAMRDLGPDAVGTATDPALLRWQDAVGWAVRPEPCAELGASRRGIQVGCVFAVDLLGSAELGLGPFPYQVLLISVVDGVVAQAGYDIDGIGGRTAAIWDPFRTWVAQNAPEQGPRLFVDWPEAETPALTADAASLWRQAVESFLAAQDPARPA